METATDLFQRGKATARDLLRQGKTEEIWDRYCGFLDFTIEEYMEVQRNLLEAQLPRLAASGIGSQLMRGQIPRTVEEFRAVVPLTTYKDYAPFLLDRKDEALPEKAYAWVHTSGRSGEYDFKWAPYTRRMYEVGGEAGLACLILSAARSHGEVLLKDGMKFPYTIAPPPYVSGIFTESVLEHFNFTIFPPPDRAVHMDFQERIQESFASALDEGLDIFFGVTSMLVKISEGFSGGGSMSGAAKGILFKPKALYRVVRALLRSKLKGRPLRPKDIWDLKGAMCGGMDTSIFKDRVVESWGIVPLEAYASTELGVIATQSWSRDGLTFFPQTNFWEFMTERDYQTFLEDPGTPPRTVLMDEVEPETDYILVATNFDGGVFVRYVIGDMIRITAREDTKAGVRLPQMTFVSRIDDLIDIGGFTRLTEKIIWQAIVAAGIPYEDWTIRKESLDEKPVLHLYIELQSDAKMTLEDISDRVHASLKQLDEPYRSLEEMVGLKPIVVTLLSRGTYRRYFEERQAAGADLAHLKPPHVNPPDAVIEKLLRMSSWKL